jgi:hypothetical protein
MDSSTSSPIVVSPFVPPGPLSAATKDAILQFVDSQVPPDKHTVILGVADEKGARFSVAERIGKHWTLGAGAEHQWGGDTSGHVGIVGVF